MIALCALALAGCAGDDQEPQPERQDGIDRDGRRDLIGLGVDLTGLKPDIGYALYAARRDHRGGGLAFAGYGCMTDCTDIKAGYRFAVAGRIKDPKACTGATWGEVEGCVAYTQGLAPEQSKLPPLQAEN